MLYISGMKAGKVLLVDDDAATADVLCELLSASKFEVKSCTRPSEAQQWVKENPGWPDILVTDLRMPEMSGLELLKKMRDADPSLMGILITAYGTLQTSVDAIRVGVVDFITKPLDFAALTEAIHRAVAMRNTYRTAELHTERMNALVNARGKALADAIQHLEDAYQFMLQTLVSLLEARDRSTGAHTKRVTEISECIAREMGLADDEVKIIKQGAALHDIGKIAIPDRILLKPGTLDHEEWRIMRTHVDVGYDILKSNAYLQQEAEIVYSHHEHFNGNGYPRGLKGEAICLGARIFAVADAYDAIHSKRSYSASHTAEQTLLELKRCSGTQFDPKVIEALERCSARVEQIWLNGSAAEQDTPYYENLYGELRP